MSVARSFIGKNFFVPEWGCEFVLSDLVPFGMYYLFSGESSAGSFVRIFDPRRCKITSDGLDVVFPDPLDEHRNRSIDFSKVKPGSIVDIRDRV